MFIKIQYDILIINKDGRSKRSMPYGYEQYRLEKGISPKTVVIEVSLIRGFLSYVNETYKKTVAPHEIRPIDVRNFLDIQRSKTTTDATVNRKLVYLRKWFNYMWEQGKIPVDFMPKLKYQEKLNLKINPENITLNYSELLEKKSHIYSSNIPFIAKLFFLFDLRGIRRRDAIKISIDDIEDNGEQMIVIINTGNNDQALFTVNEPCEISILLQAIEQATFRDTKYLFSKKEKDVYVPYSISSETYLNDAIAKVLGYPLKSELVRFAYVHYLYKFENKKIEEIQKLLGANIATTTSILKEALVRVKNIDYTNERRSS